jgi:transcriptional regulator NrdR family protein
MVCIVCGNDTKVTNSRPQKRANQIWRRRQCTVCGSIFTTEESPKYEIAWLVESSGGLAPFSRDKLLLSLHRSVQHRPTAIEDAAGLVDTVLHKLQGQAIDGKLSRRTIVQVVQVALNRFDTAASVHYQAYHK